MAKVHYLIPSPFGGLVEVDEARWRAYVEYDPFATPSPRGGIVVYFDSED